MLTLDVSLQDLEAFTEVARLRSLKEAARQMGRRPSSLSKTISSLEKKLGTRLFVRSLRGMDMTPEGLKLFRSAKKMVALASEMNSVGGLDASKTLPRKIFTVGSISFLCSRVIAPALAANGGTQKDYRFRLIEFQHNQLVTYGGRGAFDVALHIGPMEWTRAWHTVELLDLRWGLFGRYGHPLGARCNEDQALRFPFVVPTGWNEVDGYVSGTDNCPVLVQDRIAGNEATTAEAAAEIAENSDELIFVPEISVRKLTQVRRLQEIQVQDWPNVNRTIFISVRSDRIPKKLFDQVRSALKNFAVSSSND